jgi:hypothetical protein
MAEAIIQANADREMESYRAFQMAQASTTEPQGKMAVKKYISELNKRAGKL